MHPKNVTVSKTQRGGRHENLVGSSCLTMCDPLSLKSPGNTPVLQVITFKFSPPPIAFKFSSQPVFNCNLVIVPWCISIDSNQPGFNWCHPINGIYKNLLLSAYG